MLIKLFSTIYKTRYKYLNEKDSTNTSSSISSIQASTISTLTTINSNEQQINDLSTQDKTGILKIINKNYFFFTV